MATRVAVLGGGAWGTVLASLAAARGHDVALWEFDARAAEELARTRTTARCVPGFRLPASVSVTNDVIQAVQGRERVIVVVPSDTVRATLAAARSVIGPGTVIVC